MPGCVSTVGSVGHLVTVSRIFERSRSVLMSFVLVSVQNCPDGAWYVRFWMFSIPKFQMYSGPVFFPACR